MSYVTPTEGRKNIVPLGCCWLIEDVRVCGVDGDWVVQAEGCGVCLLA